MSIAVKLDASVVDNFIENGDPIDSLEAALAEIIVGMREDADYGSEKVIIEINNDFEHDEEDDEEEAD